MCGVLPEICEPDLVIELDTITAMYAGRGGFGGPALFPGSVLQLVPHAGVFGLSAKPLNEAGAAPPLSVAVGPLNACGDVAGAAHFAVSAASLTVADDLAVAALLGLSTSVIDTVTAYGPSSL